MQMRGVLRGLHGALSPHQAGVGTPSPPPVLSQDLLLAMFADEEEEEEEGRGGGGWSEDACL